MLRVSNGDFYHGSVWEYTKYYIRVLLYSTHKDLTGKTLLSKCETFTYNNMIRNPSLASVFWKEVGFINSIWNQVHPEKKNKDKQMPIWKMD